MLNNEEWKVFPEFPDYECSNTGFIRNIKTKRVLKSFNINSGYLCIQLYNKGYSKRYLVHRVIASTWVPNPNTYSEVNHLDGNKHNNAVSNLEWCTSSDNKQHAWKLGLYTPNYGSRGKKLGGQRKGTSKYLGVCWDANRQKWHACVIWNKKAYRQKRFTSEVEAAIYRDNLVKELGLEGKLPLNFV